jgi:hypothetical protein
VSLSHSTEPSETARSPPESGSGTSPRKARLEPHHFKRWLELFTRSVDESFAGTRADYAKQRGHAIARRMLEFLGDRRG